MAELRRAHGLEPGNSRYACVYAVALNSLGWVDEALAVLAKAHDDFPDDAEIHSFWMLLSQ